jgi:butyrate kinase
MAERLILAINPGGTSTKAGVFREAESLFEENMRHLPEDLEKHLTTMSQLPMRTEVVLGALAEKGIDPSGLTAVVGRGGAFKPLESGTYRVNRKLLEDIEEGSTLQADHPSNLGAPLAHSIAEPLGIPSFFVDPVCVDEMVDEARLSGHPLLPRISLSHALNIRMVAYKAARELGKSMDQTSLVVLHLGSGISVNAIRRGRMIDTSNANDGGPFSPQRTGALPTTGLVKLCFSGRYEAGEVKKMFLKQGGLFGYLGTDHVGEAVKRAEEGDGQADLVLRAMVYQIAKEAGAMAAVLDGELDAVVVTGGIAHNPWLVDRIGSKLAFLGRMLVYPGESELEALARGVLRVLDSVEEEKTYS